MDEKASSLHSSIQVLCVGLEDAAKELLRHSLKGVTVTTIAYDTEKLMETLTPPPQLIICGHPGEQLPIVEVAQMLRMQYKNIPIYFAAFKRLGYDRKQYIKNGLTDAFILPLDKDFLFRKILDRFTELTNGEVKSYRSVKLIDIGPGETLNFDTSIYMPANNKYVIFSQAGGPISEEKLARLTKGNMSTLYVASDQIQHFHEYTAKKLSAIGESSGLSETEKREKLESAIRDLMSGLFNETSSEATFDQGKTLLKECQNIVSSFILSSPKADWYNQLINAMGEQNTGYCHSSNTATYAALFSIGLGLGDPAQLAAAGIFHDIGLSDIPLEISSEDEKEGIKDGKILNQKHPEYSVDFLKRKKLILPANAVKAILQHHEAYNGTGYPNGLVGDRICIEAQILSLADKFDELTTASAGRPLMSPLRAVEYFRDQIYKDPGNMIFNPELVKKLLKLFPSGEPKNE